MPHQFVTLKVGGYPKGDNGNLVYISADFGQKKSGGNENINLEGSQKEIFKIVVTDFGIPHFGLPRTLPPLK